MNITKDQWTSITRALLVAALAIASILGYDIAIVQPREAAIAAKAQPLTRGVSHFTEIEADTLKAAAPTSVGTATPALMVDSDGVSVILEVRDAGTPVFTVADGGGVSWPSGALHVSAPTAIATATPAFFVDSDGVSVIFEVRDAATPVFSVDDGGAVSWPSGHLAVTAPTAIATATPAFVVDTTGVSNIFEVRAAATPVWYTTAAGATTGTGALTIGGALTMEEGESVNTNTDDIFDFTRNDSGAVTLLCSDDDATCAMVYDAGGAAPITIGSADVTGITVTTDGTGDAELALPENSIGPDEGAFMTDVIYFCGQQGNNGTIYFSPVLAFLTGDFTAAYVMGDAQCNDLDGATEATEDEPIGYANTAFKVLGMMCEASSTGSNGVVFTLRSAEADLTPSMTCTIATGATSCTSVTSSTTDIAAGATLAMKVVNTEDLSAQDGWCKVLIAYK